jgi:hypothetical protein
LSDATETEVDMSTRSSTTPARASRFRVARTRGAASGALLLLLGAWAALVPFIGPYLNVAYTPQPDTAWHWTEARAWMEVVPGAVAFLAGLLLIMSTSRVLAVFAGWLAAAAGAWLVVGPACAPPLKLDLGTPDPASRRSVQTLEQIVFFYGVGAIIVFLAGIALGRLTVNTLRDQRAAERRLAAEREEAAAAAAAARQPASRDESSGPAYRPQQPGTQPTGQPQYPATEQPGQPGRPGTPGTAEPPAGQQPQQGDQPTTQYQSYAAAPPPPQEN